jgi:hypothetical protein
MFSRAGRKGCSCGNCWSSSSAEGALARFISVFAGGASRSVSATSSKEKAHCWKYIKLVRVCILKVLKYLRAASLMRLCAGISLASDQLLSLGGSRPLHDEYVLLARARKRPPSPAREHSNAVQGDPKRNAIIAQIFAPTLLPNMMSTLINLHDDDDLLLFLQYRLHVGSIVHPVHPLCP